MEKKRNSIFDIAKGITILLIVLGHIRGTNTPAALNNAISFVYYFHVAVFFVISGFFSSPQRDWKNYITKKAKRLVIPYLITNVILLIVEYAYKFCITGHFTVPSALFLIRVFIGIEPVWLAGPVWFLMTLFYILLAYKLIFSLFKKKPLPTLLTCVAIAFASYFFQNNSEITGSVFISRTCISLSFFAFGHYLHEKTKGQIVITTKTALISTLASVTILLVLFSVIRYRVDYFWQRHYNLTLNYLASIAGTILVISISQIIESCTKMTKGFFQFCGKNTMYILIGHFPVFLLITIIQSKLRGTDFNSILSSICPDPSHGWWIIYLVAGTTVPLLVKMALSRIKGSE